MASESVDAELEALREKLEVRAAEFQKAHGRRYEASDLKKDPEWDAAQLEYRRLSSVHAEKLAAAAGVACRAGGCRFFISRRRRFCSNMAAVGSVEGLCTEHATVRSSSKAADKQDGKKNRPPSDQEGEGGEGAGGEGVRSKRKHNMARPPKHMLNPFKCQEAAGPEAWGEVYDDLERPLLLDIGCAKGRWLEEMAGEEQVRLTLHGRSFNYLGVELYAPLALGANRRRDAAQRRAAELPGAGQKGRNLHFVGANIMTSLRSMQIPNLHTVCIQFPDPWIKKRKRRVVSAGLARELGALLPGGGGQVYLSSDYLALALDMRATFLATGLFEARRRPTCDLHPPPHAGQQQEEEEEGGKGLPAAVAKLPSVVTWAGSAWCARPDMRWLPARPLLLGTERDQVTPNPVLLLSRCQRRLLPF